MKKINQISQILFLFFSTHLFSFYKEEIVEDILAQPSLYQYREELQKDPNLSEKVFNSYLEALCLQHLSYEEYQVLKTYRT